MAAHAVWALVCRLFAGGTPVLRTALSPRDVDALSVLGKAVKPTTVDQSFVLCPHCQQHRAQVWGDGRGGRMCRCPDCGPVAVEANDGAALALDEDWQDAPRARHRKPRRYRRSGRRRVATWRCPPVARPPSTRFDAHVARTRAAGSGVGGGRRHPGDHLQAAHDTRGAIRPWCGMACAGGALHVLRRWDCTRRHTSTGRTTDRRRSDHAGVRAVFGRLQVGDAAGHQ